jgi:hypothetical protein
LINVGESFYLTIRITFRWTAGSAARFYSNFAVIRGAGFRVNIRLLFAVFKKKGPENAFRRLADTPRIQQTVC